MAGPDTKRASRALLPWLAKAALAVSGVSLALRLSRPAPAPPGPGADDDAKGGAAKGGDAAGSDQAAYHDANSGHGRPATPASPQARDEGHETEDMSGGLMGKLALMLGTVACVVVFAMVGLRFWVLSDYRSDQPALTALQVAPTVPPGPHLQADPVKDIAQLHAEEDALLQNYAWVDKSRTRARIPINRAMALVVGRSLEGAP